MISINSNKILKKIEQGKKFDIVCFGDSITWGHYIPSYITQKQTKNNYPKVLEKKLQIFYKNKNIKVHNISHSGWTSFDAINNKKILNKIVSIKPDLVIAMFGINDVISFPRTDILDYKNNMTSLISFFKKEKIELLILSSTPIHLMDRILSRYAKAVMELSQKNNIYTLDLRKKILEYIKDKKLNKFNIIAIDNVHFWENKYAIISDIILKNFFKSKST